MKDKSATINLLPQEEFEASTLGRTLKWLLTTFRYIVIATEMIVTIAFLSRFWLDEKSSVLIDGINQKKAIIASYSTFESQFRLVQNKLKVYKDFSGEDQKISPIIDIVSSQIPSDVKITQISITGTKIEITAQTENENSASNFVTNLNSSNIIVGAAVTSVETKLDTPGVSFTITGTVQRKAQNG